MEPVLFVYTAELNPRVEYAFSLFFESLITTPYKLTKDIAEYKTYSGPKLNYSAQQIEKDKLFFQSHGLLTQTGIVLQEITVSEWNGLKIFYQVKDSVLPFDIFAAGFYLVSRYEEYLNSAPDEHHRFKSGDSLAFKNNFLNMPIVNLWALELKKLLLKEYPQLTIKENTYKFIPTIDIDIAYAHLGKKIGVTLGSYFKLLSRFKIGGIFNKAFVLLGLRKDEYDTYQYQEEIFKKYSIRPIYFFLAGKRTTYDRNIDTDSVPFSALIKKLSSFADVGIHPSYHSASQAEIVGEEIKRVENNLTEKVTKSRQHFLKIVLPDTYRCLAQLGIADDYSIAYADAPGFRAGICVPFLFYDLKAEQTLPVRLHSTIAMEGTFNEYLHRSPEEAISTIQKLILQVKMCNGEFIGIWHNHSLNDKGHWNGWRKVFEAMIEAGR
jgi:hypothetical protein